MEDNIKFEFSQVGTGIYQVKFDNEFDAALTFLRVMEFKEDPKLSGTFFTIMEFMRSYASRHDWIFSYPEDWSGFNLTDDEIKKVYFANKENIRDFNFYDDLFLEIVKKIPNFETEKFALFGFHPRESDNSISIHEICHAIYYLDKEYKKKVHDILEQPQFSELIKELQEFMKEWGYDEKSAYDEINAYFSTGLDKEIKRFLRTKNLTGKATLLKQKLRKCFKNVKNNWIFPDSTGT